MIVRLAPILLLAATLPSLPAQDPEGSWNRACREFEAPLAQLAEWTEKKQLKHQAHRLYEVLLHFAPDHERARRVLGYRKSKAGKWERKGRYRQPRERNSRWTSDFDLRWETLKHGFVTKAFEILESEENPPDLVLQGKITRTLLLAAPDNEKVRKLGGEVEHEGKWMLVESVRTLKQRHGLLDMAAEYVDDVKEPKPFEIPERDKKFGIEWKSSARTKVVKVVSTLDPGETSRHARFAEAGGRFIRSVLKMGYRFPYGYQLFVMQNHAERDVFLEHVKEFDAAERARVKRLTGTHFGQNLHAQWGTEPKGRLDLTTRTTMQMFLGGYYGIHSDEAWVMEGMGLYLSGLICRTRLTWFVAPAKYAKKEQSKWERKMRETFDWLPIARELILSKQAPSLRHVFRRTLNTLSEEDLLVAYAFSAFLLEGRPDSIPPILRAITEERDGAKAVFDTLGMDERQLTERLMRWLRETKDV